MAHWSKNQPGPQHRSEDSILGCDKLPQKLPRFFFVKVESDKNLPHPKLVEFFESFILFIYLGKQLTTCATYLLKKLDQRVRLSRGKKTSRKTLKLPQPKRRFCHGFFTEEYDPLTDQGVHLNFWDGRRWRFRMAEW